MFLQQRATDIGLDSAKVYDMFKRTRKVRDKT